MDKMLKSSFCIRILIYSQNINKDSWICTGVLSTRRIKLAKGLFKSWRTKRRIKNIAYQDIASRFYRFASWDKYLIIRADDPIIQVLHDEDFTEQIMISKEVRRIYE